LPAMGIESRVELELDFKELDIEYATFPPVV
jgi:hypothetical protein